MAELGIKVFGNEISYWNAEGDEEILKSLARLNPQLRVLEILSGKVKIPFVVKAIVRFACLLRLSTLTSKRIIMTLTFPMKKKTLEIKTKRGI